MEMLFCNEGFSNQELTQQQLSYPELKQTPADSSAIQCNEARELVERSCFSRALQELRGDSGERGSSRERKRLTEVLCSEEKLLAMKTTEINSLLRKAAVSQEQWRSIKGEKRKIRKKMNKRASDQRSKEMQLECNSEVVARQKQKLELQAEIEYLERECQFYLMGVDRLQREARYTN